MSIEEPEAQKIYSGDAKNFSNPAGIDFVELLKETKEYKYIVKKRIKSGTGKYWILISQASDRVVKSLSGFEYDLIADIDYLKELKIKYTDITKKVKKKLALSPTLEGRARL